MKVEERLLLNGIDGQRRGASVALLNQLSANVFPDIAEAVLAHADVAVARAEIAVNTPVRECLPPARGMECGGHRQPLTELYADSAATISAPDRLLP